MDSAPFIPTSIDTKEQAGDSATEALNETLNSVTLLPQNPSFSRGDRLAAGIDDRDFNVGYKQLPVDSQVSIVGHYESPELPLNNIPNPSSIHDSTLAYKAVNGQVLVPMRAPDINEGL